MEKERKRRVTRAWQTFWPMKYILQDNSISRSLRLTTLNTCIYPDLLYGCQTWSENEHRCVQKKTGEEITRYNKQGYNI